MKIRAQAEDLGKVTLLLDPSFLLKWARSNETHLWGTEVKMKQGIKCSVHSRLSARLFPSPSAIPPHPPKSVGQEEDGLITTLQRRKLRCTPGWMAYFQGHMDRKWWRQDWSPTVLLPNSAKFPIFCCQTLWLSGDLHEEMSGKVVANSKAFSTSGT